MALRRKQPRVCTAMGASVNFPALEKLLPHRWGIAGFVFTNEDLTEIRDTLLGSKVQASVHAGAITRCEVIVPARTLVWGGSRPLSSRPLGLTSKISRGTAEILSAVSW